MDFLPETVLNVDVGYSRSYFRQLQPYSRVLPLTYDETTSTCTMTGTDCATLSCGSTGFEITFQFALFNLDDGQSSATFAGGFLVTWEGSKWALNAPFEERGMAYNIDVDIDA